MKNLLFCLLVLLLGTAFADAADHLLDIPADECLKSPSCSAEAEPIMEKYSLERRIRVEELREYLMDCNQNQSSMNSCADFGYYAAEQELDAIVNNSTRDSSEKCQRQVKHSQSNWRKAIYQSCKKMADTEIGAGSAWASVATSCEEDAMVSRIKKFQSIGSCVPCSKCLKAQ